MMVGDPAITLEVAERIARLIAAEGGRAVVIGAVALAVHGYPRATRDLDLATEIDPYTHLARVAERLAASGFEVAVAMPDADNPLGGVLTVRRHDIDPIQVVNFYNPLRPSSTPAGAALDRATLAIEGSELAVVAIPDLVALKLYAGGLKSLADVVELLRRQPTVDRAALEAACAPFGLESDLERVFDELS